MAIEDFEHCCAFSIAHRVELRQPVDLSAANPLALAPGVPEEPEIVEGNWLGVVRPDSFVLHASPHPGQRAVRWAFAADQGVHSDVWNFHVGGYQVCEKWLKDRKGRTLTANDIVHYDKIVAALSETIRLMEEIDQVIDQHGGWPDAFQGTDPAPESQSRDADPQLPFA